MSLPEIYVPHNRYQEVRERLLEAIRADTQLDVEDGSDWLVTLCDGWARIAEIVTFYDERIANETFPSTAVQPASQSRIAHSLGADLPPRVGAMVTLTYQLSEAAAAVEAAVRARTAGSGATPEELARASRRHATGAAPVARGRDGSAAGNGGTGEPGPAGSSYVKSRSQVKAIPSPSGHAPVFSTVESLDAHVSLTQLTPLPLEPPAPPPLAAGATQIELAGTRSGLAAGQPALIAGADPAAALPLQWIRILTAVQVDQRRASTRIGWETPLGELPGEPPPSGIPSVIGFTASASLAGAGAAPWSTLPLVTRLAQTANGKPVAVRGGLASSSDAGATWTAPRSGAPTGRLTAVCAANGVVLAAGEQGLIRANDGVAFAPVTLPGRGQTVVSLSVTDTGFLAGTGHGVLYQSIDGGQSFTQITGGPPQISPPPSSGTTSQVTSFQLPPVAVRCAMVASAMGSPPQLVAGTDRGAFVYDGTNWRPASPPASPSGSAPPPPPPPQPILALALHDGQRVGGTPTGAIALDTRSPYGRGLSARVNALTTLATDPATTITMPLYAGTDTGVFRLQAAGGQWQPANGDAAVPGTISLRGVSVNALVASAGTLFAGTATGVVCSTDGGTTWTPHGDRALVVSGDARAVGAITPGDPAPEGLRTLFAQAGVTVPTGTLVTTGASGPQVVVDRRTFALTQAEGEWQIWLRDALPGIVALAAHAGTLWAAGAPPDTVADTWPGFAVAGGELELAPPVKSAVTGPSALIEQRTGTDASALALSVTAVEQDVATRFGRRAPLTRLRLAAALDAGTFDRDTATVWLGGVELEPFAPPRGAPTQLSGDRPVMAGPLTTAIPSGRLAALTGRPVALTVAPLGGATRVSVSGAAPLGLAQVDVLGVAFDPTGLAFLATGDGVFSIAGPGPGREPVLLGPGAPAGEAVAVAICATTVLAAFTGGLARRATNPAPGGAPQWESAGFAGAPVSALAADGDTAYALAGQTVYRCDAVGAPTPVWSALPAPPQPPTCLAACGGVLWTGTATGVQRYANETWMGAGSGLPSGAVRAICATSDGSVFAGSTVGFYGLAASAPTWQPEALPLTGSSVLALGTDASAEIVAVATEDGVASLRAGGEWVALPNPLCDTAALAVAADGSVWLGARAELRLRAADGRWAATALRHRKVFDGVAAQASDIATLSQGGLPPAVSAAFQSAGAALDTAAAVVANAPAERVWTIRCGSALSILAAREGTAGTTFSGFLTQTPATATGPERPARAGSATWPVELDGQLGTLQAPAAALLVLAAGKDAPSLAETVRVTRAQTVDRPAGQGTELQLAAPLVHVYDAATVTVSLNAVAAAEGRPATVALGSGDPQQAFQSFTVPTPVAAVAATSAGAPEAQGTSTTLEILVSGEPWGAVSSLLSRGAEDRVYRTRTNSDGSVVVQFGDGAHGARLPAGHNNVVATYLDPGPTSSDIASGRLIQALDRAQMVSGVSNPSAALVPPVAGPDRLRLASLRTVQRIVTLHDIQDLAAAQPGVHVACSELLSGGGGREIVVTVAPTPDAPLDLEDRVRAVLLAAAAPAPPIRVLAARSVPVRLALAVTVEGAGPDDLRAAIGGLAAQAPGRPLLASQIIRSAVALTGVIAARIEAWGRANATPSRATFVAAGGAVRDPRTLVLRGAELLAIDPGEQLLRIATEEAHP